MLGALGTEAHFEGVTRHFDGYIDGVVRTPNKTKGRSI